MSNIIVGNVYQQIIEKVIAASNNDFEEFGVDQSTLDEMKQGWQDRLSALKVASFPWDPQPEPPRQPPTVPSNAKIEADLLPPGTGPQEHVNSFPNAHIKQERFEAPLSGYPQASGSGTYTGGYNSDIAQQRAHNLIAQRLQTQQNIPGQQAHGQMPMQHQQHIMMSGAQQPPQQQRPTQLPQRPPQNHVYTSQTDGADDGLAEWQAFKTARAAQTEQGRIIADQLMRSQVEALVAQQDSGLMMPLSHIPKSRKPKTVTRMFKDQEALGLSSSASPAVPALGRYDGEDDEEKEHDSDAINSDLDDPDDDAINGDDSDDETMDYMLCTYDKVQRVKNKWKCILKDGILTTNKKEYLFHKANGEFEW